MQEKLENKFVRFLVQMRTRKDVEKSKLNKHDNF